MSSATTSISARKRLNLPLVQNQEQGSSMEFKRPKLESPIILNTPRTVPSPPTCPNSKQSTYVTNLEQGMIIDEFRILGCGKTAKAIHQDIDGVFDATVMTSYSGQKALKVIERVKNARDWYTGHSLDELSDRMFPRNAHLAKFNDFFVLFTPVKTKSLDAYMVDNRETITELEVKRIFDQILRIVNFCHQCGILIGEMHVHKFAFFEHYEKIIFCALSECTVLDHPDNDMIRERFITPAFAPPEALMTVNNDCYSAKCSEMWSLGVFLYQLLFGRYPFVDKSPRAVFQQIRTARLMFPRANVSSEGRMLLFTLLKKDPYERPTAKDLVVTPYWQFPMTGPCKIKQTPRPAANPSIGLLNSLLQLRATNNSLP